MDISAEIPVYQVFIHPMDLKELKRDIWCEDPLPAQLKAEGKRLEIDIRYRGSHIRDFKKKSYQATFYKPPVFKGSKDIHLNAEYKDPSMIRNKLSFDFFTELGCLAPRSRHIFLKINGKAEGVYLEIESVDENFLKKRGLPEGAIFYAVDGDANFSLMSDLDKETKKSLFLGYERKVGNDQDNFPLEQMIYKLNTIPNNEFEREISQLVNVDKYLKWMAGVILTQNYDGFVHNYSLYKSGETGLFEVLPWDYDATWGRDVNGKYMSAEYVRIEGFNTLTARLLYVDNFRKKYKNILGSALENQFTIDNLKPKVEALYNHIRPAVLLDPYRKDKIDHFDREPEFIFSFIEKRSAYIKNQLGKLD
ncbi:CotH kinase family protein [Neobacillus terrae]|uniref:CotH kinase family protein n=1 Tax=Neobacillus terrae TaxID=3034837 RepID=UPI00140DF8FD|nr:CotH kinase family protein [Neobacillus terrae]NHM32305.1 spore coat protein [Neobacillus terrae]